jgi:toxin FitB
VSGSLLDTSVLIGPVPAHLDSLPPTAAISVISLGELHAGVRLARDEATQHTRESRLQAVLTAFAPLDVDERVAEEYGRILAVARTVGRTERATDLLIVATAAAHTRRLYTRDERQASLAATADVPVVLV